MLQRVNWLFRNFFFLAVGSCFADVAVVGERCSKILDNKIRAEDHFPIEKPTQSIPKKLKIKIYTHKT